MKMQPGDYIHKSDIPDEVTHNRIREVVQAMGYPVHRNAGAWRLTRRTPLALLLDDDGDLMWTWWNDDLTGRRFTPADLLDATSMTWQQVCRELLRLDAEGYDNPWREFEGRGPASGCMHVPETPGKLVDWASNGVSIRFKPRTVRVTTHDGETLELPEPWWDVPDRDERFWYVDSNGSVYGNSVCGRAFAACGNAFRTHEDAQAWADAMPKIRGRG